MFAAIKSRFATDEIELKRLNLAKISVSRFRVFELIDFLVERYEYVTLNAIACADWIEEEHFAISYMLTTRDRKHTFMVQTMILRENAHIDSLVPRFKQAEIMERDLHEMYGIAFLGNDNRVELSLENWIHTPPLRREFDTLEFVNDHLTFREGRDDNIDVKVEAKRLRALKKAAKEAKAKAAEKNVEKDAEKDGKKVTEKKEAKLKSVNVAKKVKSVKPVKKEVKDGK